MSVLRQFRQSDNMKAAVMLTAAAMILIGYCIRSAIAYALILQTPPEYVCDAPAGIDNALAQLSGEDSVRAYSRQKTAYLAQNGQMITVTMLSAAYLSDCFSLDADAHTVWMNEAAFAAMHPASGQTADFRGELDGEAFSARLVCTEHLPQAEPFAVLAVSAAELHDTETVRICAADQNAFSPALFGLTVTNPEAQCAAEYEQEMLLLRIRFGVLSAVLALLGAAAFFRLHNRKIEKYKTICAGSQSAENTLPIGS